MGVAKFSIKNNVFRDLGDRNLHTLNKRVKTSDIKLSRP